MTNPRPQAPDPEPYDGVFYERTASPLANYAAVMEQRDGIARVYEAEGVIEVRGRPRQARRRGTAPAASVVDLVLVPWWEDNERGAEWDTVTVNGTQWPGTAKVSGRGVGRKLDVKSRGGADGARVIDKGYEPGRFDITFSLWTSEHVDALGALLPVLNPRRAGAAAAHTVDVYHPALALAGIGRAVVDSVGILQPGSTVGVWELKVSLVEYRPPTPRPTQAVTPGASSLASVPTAFPAPRDEALTTSGRPSATNAEP